MSVTVVWYSLSPRTHEQHMSVTVVWYSLSPRTHENGGLVYSIVMDILFLSIHAKYIMVHSIGERKAQCHKNYIIISRIIEQFTVCLLLGFSLL